MRYIVVTAAAVVSVALTGAVAIAVQAPDSGPEPRGVLSGATTQRVSESAVLDWTPHVITPDETLAETSAQNDAEPQFAPFTDRGDASALSAVKDRVVEIRQTLDEAFDASSTATRTADALETVYTSDALPAALDEARLVSVASDRTSEYVPYTKTASVLRFHGVRVDGDAAVLLTEVRSRYLGIDGQWANNHTLERFVLKNDGSNWMVARIDHRSLLSP